MMLLRTRGQRTVICTHDPRNGQNLEKHQESQPLFPAISLFSLFLSPMGLTRFRGL